MLVFDLRYYRLVVAVQEEGTLTRAANKLHVTQSALSHQLKELESGLKHPVFLRVNNKMILTEVGKMFLNSSRKILNEEINLKASLYNYDFGIKRKIKIGFGSLGATYWMLKILNASKFSHLDADLEFYSLNKFDAIERIKTGQLDALIIEEDISIKQESSFSVTELAKSEKIFIGIDKEIDTLKIKNLISLSDDLYHSRFFMDLQSNKIIRSPVVNSVSQLNLLIHLVKTGFGVGIIDSWIIKEYIESVKLNYRTIDLDTAKTKWVLLTTKNFVYFDKNKDFIKSLKEILELFNEI